MKQRTVFFLSDRTGITAETLGLSLISQFEGVYFTQNTLPFVDSVEKAYEASKRINQAFEQDGSKPLVFATIVSQEIRTILKHTQGYYLDFFDTFIPNLEVELKTSSANLMGRAHSATHSPTYHSRMEAVNFSLNYDDGARTSGYDSATVILIGVSRCGKTPTSLYLAMQYGIRAANYPLTEEDITPLQLPKILQPYREKLFGLTIDPARLHTIRSGRKPNSHYATLSQCEKEIKAVEKLFRQENIPFLNSTDLSIEELATKLMAITGIQRRTR